MIQDLPAIAMALAVAAALTLVMYVVYQSFISEKRFQKEEKDRYGRKHVRDERNGRFVKA